jgi:DNA-directed RNA polymerase specialized sigma24 family protein
MEKLPDHHRDYLHDRYERRLSSKQIAELYRKTVSAVDTLMSRIRAALLDCMKRGREALV